MIESLRSRFREWSLATPDVEVNAILLGSPHPAMAQVESLVLATNVHSRPESNFMVSPLAFLGAEGQAKAKGLSIVGIAHSHTVGSALPSEDDLAMMRSDRVESWWIWPIYSVRHDELKVWGIRHGGLVDLTRPPTS